MKIKSFILFVLFALTTNVKAQVEIVSSGTGAAYILNVPAVFPLRNGVQVTFKANVVCAASPTIDISSTGAKSIRKEGGTVPLSAGDIKAGQVVTLVYDGVNWQMLSSLGNASGNVTGGGTENYVTKWNTPSGTNLGNSSIYDGVSGVGIFNNTPAGDLHIFKNNGPRFILDADGANINGSATIDFTTGGNNSATSFVGAGGVTGWQLKSYTSGFSTAARQNDFAIRYYNGSSFTNSMYFDNNGNIGIDFLNPTSKLYIVGSGNTNATSSLRITNSSNSDMLYVDDIGQVGIRTAIPSANLHVVGTARITGLVGPGTVVADALGNLSINATPSNAWNLGGNGVTSIQNLGTTTNFDLPFITNGIERMRLTSAGNIGIGTVSPYNMLSIVQNVGASTDAGTFIDLQNNSGILGSLSAIRFKNNSSAANDRFGAAIFYRTEFGTGAGEIRFALQPNMISNISTDSTKMIIKENGNVGIGTIIPSTRLHIVGGARITGLVGPGTVIADAAGNLSLAAGGTITGNGTNDYLARWTPSGTQLGIGVVQDNGINVGINSSPSGTDKLFIIASSNNGLGINNSVNLAGQVKVGADINVIGSGSMNIGSRGNTSGANTNYSFFANASGGAQINYGGYFMASGAGTATNYGIYASASGGTNNYAGIFEQGNVGIGTTAPAQPLTVLRNAQVNKYVVQATAQQIAGTGDFQNVAIAGYGQAGPSYGFGIGVMGIGNPDWGGTGVYAGLGTAFPLHQINGNHYALFADAGTAAGNKYAGVFMNGNVGIATLNPSTQLHVQGNARITGLAGPGTVIADVNGNLSLAAGSAVTGSGSPNYVARWTPSGSMLGTGLIYDDNNVVGIGTGPSPSNSRLNIHSISGNGNLRLTSAGTGQTSTDGFSMTNDGSSIIYMWQHENADWNFVTSSGANAITIKPTTNIGFGTGTPSGKLHLYQATGATRFEIESDGAGATDAPIIEMDAAGANVGQIAIEYRENGAFMASTGWSTLAAQKYWFVYDGASAQSMVYKAGKLGIGTNVPAELVHMVSTDSDIDAETYSATESSSLHIKRARGSSGAPASVSSGDYFGGIGFKGYNSGSFLEGAVIEGVVDGAPSATSMPGRLEFWTTPIGSTTAVNRMTIKNNGFVGIGTSPSYPFHVLGSSTGYFSYLDNNSPTGGYAVRGSMDLTATGAGDRYGVYGNAWYGQSFNYGVYGYGFGGTISYGVYGQGGGATTNYAGYFNGAVHVNGALSKSSGAFKIDDPRDPENKYLMHSFVESPDMMNIYNGNITTGTDGTATVQLPDYFGILNKDFRYQLTVIGDFAQAIVFKEIADNKFIVKTDKPNIKVSWQVTGIRKDPYAEKNRIPNEIEKPEGEKGKYLNPEVYGQPKSKGVGYDPEKDPELKK